MFISKNHLNMEKDSYPNFVAIRNANLKENALNTSIKTRLEHFKLTCILSLQPNLSKNL